MDRILKLSIFLLLVSSTHGAYSAVFKCEKNGEITFSDKPCTGHSTDITEQHQKSIPKKTNNAAAITKKTKKLADSMESKRKKREAGYKITALEKQINDIKKTRDSELKILKERRESIYEGDDMDDEVLTIELKKKITKTMSEVTQKYDAEIDAINKEIEGLLTTPNKPSQ